MAKWSDIWQNPSRAKRVHFQAARIAAGNAGRQVKPRGNGGYPAAQPFNIKGRKHG